jgi:sec-independent protein translocase protein TatB
MMGAMSFSETIFLFFLALIVFGPKKLPEIARQAGKLLAELRRASNEFKSQIETEIAHLEVQKTQTAALPSAQPPQGSVASLSLSPAATESVKDEPVKQEQATLAAPQHSEPTPALADSSDLSSAAPSSSSTAVETVAVPDPEPATASQDSHV